MNCIQKFIFEIKIEIFLDHFERRGGRGGCIRDLIILVRTGVHDYVYLNACMEFFTSKKIKTHHISKCMGSIPTCSTM